MQIKILINVNPFYLSSAGGNRWLTLIQGLSDLGVEIQLLVLGSYQSKEEKEKFTALSNFEGIEIKYITTKVVEGLWQRRYQTYIGKHIQLLKIETVIKNELTDFKGIVWAENDLDIWKIITKIPNKPFKLIAEMSEFLDIHQYNKGNALQRKLGDAKQNYFENVYIQKLDGFLLMTKTLMSHYENFPQLKAKVLHLPMTVDLERFDKNLPVTSGFEQPYIAFVGVMNDAKDGVAILIEAFATIHTQFPKHKIYLVGGWHYDTPHHQKLIKQYGLEEKVFWKGEFSRNEIPAIINNASLLALPRPDSKQAQGGFPTKLGEYLATGNPVCATTVGELPDYLVDNESVYFAAPGSIESFADAMKNALSNPQEAKIIGNNGQKVAEKRFNKHIQSKLLYNFLKEIQNENSK
jgi:glycosyltransferase involved in cell wall biosynthesis